MMWHLITPEYPPQPGGVSDYTRMVANGLAAAGDEVHIWCPRAERELTSSDGIVVHQELGRFTRSDLRVVDRMLNQFEGPRRLLVQWVPHGYGYQSMNLGFCFWLWRRARQGDKVEIMVHEPFLSFREGSWKQSGAATVHRLMTIVLLRAASRVWMSIPAWEAHWRPYALGRPLKFTWLPVASNIPVVDSPDGVRAIRARYSNGAGALVGHFGTCDRHITELLLSSVSALMQNGKPPAMLMLGRGSKLMREQLIRQHPEIANRVHATGELDAGDLSLHLSACDVMLQPYIDGVSSRRTSTMVALAHGVPVVTTSGKLTEPLWAGSEAVALAPVGDVSTLVQTTQRLLPDAAARRRMSAAAKSLYAERFDVSHIIDGLRETNP
jgi:glycosyltransferase involved in cell wall biosynthesis